MYRRSVLPSLCTVLLILAIALAGCSSPQGAGSPAPAPAATAAPGAAVITLKGFTFSPAAITVSPGTTVTWVNEDPAPHTVLSDPGAPGAFTSPSLAKGESFRFTFTDEGTYPYHCSIHPSMTGTVTVRR